VRAVSCSFGMPAVGSFSRRPRRTAHPKRPRKVQSARLRVAGACLGSKVRSMSLGAMSLRSFLPSIRSRRLRCQSDACAEPPSSPPFHRPSGPSFSSLSHDARAPPTVAPSLCRRAASRLARFSDCGLSPAATRPRTTDASLRAAERPTAGNRRCDSDARPPPHPTLSPRGGEGLPGSGRTTPFGLVGCAARGQAERHRCIRRHDRWQSPRARAVTFEASASACSLR
jgi:hypothetical protein